MSDSFIELSYHTILRAGRVIRPGGRKFLYTIGLAVSPSVALTDENERQRRPMFWSTIRLAAIVLLFSIGFNLYFSWLNGRLWPDGIDQTKNFFEDKSNLILYTFICPLYVALSIQIIMISSRYGVAVDDATRPTSQLEAARSPFALTLCLAIAAAFAVKYVGDVAVGADGRTYWFNDRIGDIRVLNSGGIYYSIMVFAFLSTVLMAALNLLSITASAMRLVNSLSAQDCGNAVAMRSTFFRSKQAFVYGRWLIAILMIHVVVWSESPLSNTVNLDIGAILLVLAAIFLTALPSLHLERRLKAVADQCGLDIATLDIEPVTAKRWLPLANAVINIGFFGSFIWGIEPARNAIKWVLG